MQAYFQTARGQRMAWYLYDFGNSAYAAVVLLAIYPTFFKDHVVGGAEGSRLWGLAVAAAMLIAAVISPVLGAVADRHGAKKRMLGFFTAMACIFTASLFLVSKGDVVAAIVLFVLAETGYRSAQVFYNALLPEIAPRSEIGRISGNGWAIGSAGGIVCLAIVLPIVILIGGPTAVASAFLITAVFFAASTVPLFLHVRERPAPDNGEGRPNAWTSGFRQLAVTARKARNYREYLKFLAAFMFLNDAVMIALNFAAIIGGVLHGLHQQQLIMLMILVQVFNVAGAWVFGQVTDHASGKGALMWASGIFALSVAWLLVNEDPTTFFVITCIAGFAIAGLQAVSRTMVAKLTPAAQAGEFYGLFAVAGRSSSVIGPAIFGWIAAEAALAYLSQGMEQNAAEQAGMRLAILLILAFTAAGTAILYFVREDEAPAGADTAEAAA